MTAVKLGVDFGTTRTVVACADRGNFPIVGFADGAGNTLEWFPSMVAVRGDRIVYGVDALAVQDEPGWSVLRSFKRLLSGPRAAPDRVVKIGARATTVIELLTGFLTALREAVLSRSTAPRSDAAITAVVGTPAHAHGTQRFLTLEAFRRAGFDVVAMLNEPSAAGFEYTHRYRHTLNTRRRDVIVYDLGGGTFDASRIRADGRRHAVLRTAGDARLGGDDFDARLAVMVLDALGLDQEQLDDATVRRLLDRARIAKEALHPNSRRATVDLEGLAGLRGAPREMDIATADYYEACAALVDRTCVATAPLLAFDESAGDGDESDIAGLYVVGGASALPAVSRALRERFGARVHRSPYPFASTAIGLAVALDGEEGFEVSDQLSRHFGVFREAERGQAVTFDTLLRADTRVPASPARPVLLRRRYQPAHNIGHFRFAECTEVDDGGRPLGEITPFGDILFPFDRALRDRAEDLSRVPVRRADAAGPAIEEQYSVDPHGMVHVAIVDTDDGYRREYQLGAV